MHFYVDLAKGEEDQRIVLSEEEAGRGWPRLEVGVDTEKEELLFEAFFENDGLGPASIGVARIPFALIKPLLRTSLDNENERLTRERLGFPPK